MRLLGLLRYHSVERIRTWKAIREYHRGLHDDPFWQQSTLDNSWDQQTIQLIHQEGGAALYNGRAIDSLQFDAILKAQGRRGVQIHLGHENLPDVDRPDVFAIEYTIGDGPGNSLATWMNIAKLVRFAVRLLKSGTSVLSSCDMSASRSRMLSGAISSLWFGAPFSQAMRYEIRNRAYDGALGRDFPPNAGLWSDASLIVGMLHEESTPEIDAIERELTTEIIPPEAL